MSGMVTETLGRCVCKSEQRLKRDQFVTETIFSTIFVVVGHGE
jgi:hypothetical protein